MHWALQYIGKPWSDSKDCFYWFRYWSKVHFGVEMQDHQVSHKNLAYHAARIMAGDIHAAIGYVPTEEPKEGDAVFLSQRTRPHHIGMVIYPGTKRRILHAVEGVGVIASDDLDLALNGWTIKGYWTHAA